MSFAQAYAEVRIKPERLSLSHVTTPIHSYIAFVSIIPKQYEGDFLFELTD